VIVQALVWYTEQVQRFMQVQRCRGAEVVQSRCRAYLDQFQSSRCRESFVEKWCRSAGPKHIMAEASVKRCRGTEEHIRRC
jgi:hypothetical protein